MKRLLLSCALLATIATAHAQNDPSTTVGDTGTVTFVYQGATVTYTTVRGADNMIWLQQNLGSSQIATSATDVLAYGHYFQWGRWDDAHQLAGSPTANVSTISPNNPQGIPTGSMNFLIGSNPNDWWGGGAGTDTWSNNPPSTTNGTDPCAAIAPGWHLPSVTELGNVITVENITDVATAFGSNLKLTAAGARDGGSGTFINIGSVGQVWTSTTSGPYAKSASIQASAINPSDDALRGYGASVRCMSSCTGVFPPSGITGDDTICEGSTNTYTVPAVNNANSYTWTVPTGWTIVGSSTGTTITVITGTSGGTISASAVNTCGTSTATTLNVVVNPLPVPVINGTGNVLSTGTFVSYQWLVNDTIINGATSNPHTAVDTGDYQVIVTDANGCSDTSSVFNYTTTTGIESANSSAGIRIFPNPATTAINIKSPIAIDATIYGVDGRKVLEQRNAKLVDISSLPAGTYQVNLSDKTGQVLKTEKLVVLPH